MLLSFWLALAASTPFATAARTPLSGVKSNLNAGSNTLSNSYLIELDNSANLRSIPGSRRALVSVRFVLGFARHD